MLPRDHGTWSAAQTGEARAANGTWRAHVAASVLLLTMAILMLASLRDDVITVDERTHIAPGYSYLVRADHRLNVDHPPLMKDLAALPPLFIHLRVPWDDPSWTDAEPWRFGGGAEPQPGWVAVSAFSSQRSRQSAECDCRRRLTPEQLVTKIGWSIFVFHLGPLSSDPPAPP